MKKIDKFDVEAENEGNALLKIKKLTAKSVLGKKIIKQQRIQSASWLEIQTKIERKYVT